VRSQISIRAFNPNPNPHPKSRTVKSSLLMRLRILSCYLLFLTRGLATAVQKSAIKMDQPIGFVGLGIMGKGMAANLLKKVEGCSLVVWNRSPEVCNELVAAFPGKVTVAASAAAVIQQCSLTYSMLSTMEASEAVFDCPLEAGGVIAAVTPGKCIVDCATLSPERMQHIGGGVTSRGGLFLEAPVSGSKVPAETGTLIFLCGGEPEVYQKALPGLEAMGKANFLLGPVGAGSKMKLVVNMIMGTMMSAFAEGNLRALRFALLPCCVVRRVVLQLNESSPDPRSLSQPSYSCITNPHP